MSENSPSELPPEPEQESKSSEIREKLLEVNLDNILSDISEFNVTVEKEIETDDVTFTRKDYHDWLKKEFSIIKKRYKNNLNLIGLTLKAVKNKDTTVNVTNEEGEWNKKVHPYFIELNVQNVKKFINYVEVLTECIEDVRDNPSLTGQQI